MKMVPLPWGLKPIPTRGFTQGKNICLIQEALKLRFMRIAQNFGRDLCLTCSACDVGRQKVCSLNTKLFFELFVWMLLNVWSPVIPLGSNQGPPSTTLVGEVCLDSGSTAENFLFVLKPYEDGSSTMRLETNPNQGIYTRKEYLPHPGGLKVTFHEDCSELWARLVSHLQCLRCWAAKSVQLEHKQW